jgi:DNA-binding MltR family transcriptional regulator
MSNSQEFDVSKLKVFADEANVFMKQLMEESDRGAALAGIAYLDELLGRLFKAQMLTEKVSEELFGRFGPLSSFSSRIDVAYCLGWIGPETYRDLNLLRKIRNDFAHAHEPVTFSDAAVQSRCSELQIPKGFGYRLKPRDQFLFAASMLALRLEFYQRDSKTPAARWDPPVEQFIPPTPENT